MAHWRFSGLQRAGFFWRIGLAFVLALLFALGSALSARPAHASGGGCPGCFTVYTHTATAANTFGSWTLLDNSVTNHNPHAVIEVTANWNPDGTYTGFDNHRAGVWYDTWDGKWAIFNEDGANMPIGASFNVSASITSFTNTYYVVTATASNTDGYILFLNEFPLNSRPSEQFVVTQDMNPGGTSGVYNNHAIGIWYDPYRAEWTIYNEDLSPIPIGASFNIEDATANVEPSVNQVATSSNTSGDSTCINSPYGNVPYAVVFITHVYSGYFTDVSAVWYNTFLGEWCVFDGSYNPMPIGADFTATFPGA